MGPLLLTGLTVFGALVALGIVASTSMPRSAAGTITDGRRLALILIAFATGCGVLGVVVGVLAITLGAHLGPGSTRLLVTLTVAGALIAPFLVARNGGRVDRWIVSRAAMFGGGLTVLALVVALLSLVIHRFSSGSTPDWAFLVLGLAAAGAVLALGVLGGQSIREIAVLDGGRAETARTVAIRRILPFEALAYGASLVAIVLVVAR